MKDYQTATTNQVSQDAHDESMTVTAAVGPAEGWTPELQMQVADWCSARGDGLTTIMVQILSNYSEALDTFESTAVLPDPDKMLAPDVWDILAEWVVERTKKDLTAGVLKAADTVTGFPVSEVHSTTVGLMAKLEAGRTAATAAQSAWALADFVALIRRAISDQSSAIGLGGQLWGRQLDLFCSTASQAEIEGVGDYLNQERRRLSDVLMVKHNFSGAYMDLVGKWVTGQGGSVDIVLSGSNFNIQDVKFDVAGGEQLMRRGDWMMEYYSRLNIPLTVRWFPEGELACIEGTRYPDGTVSIDATTNLITNEQRDEFVSRVADPCTLIRVTPEECE